MAQAMSEPPKGYLDEAGAFWDAILGTHIPQVD
jgi:hypothetical protein